MNLKFKKHTGFSLIELLLIFSIIMALSVASFFLYKKVNQNSIKNDIISKVSIISSNYIASGMARVNALEEPPVMNEAIVKILTEGLGGEIEGIDSSEGYYRLNSQTIIKLQFSSYGLIIISAIVPKYACVDITKSMLSKGFSVEIQSATSKVFTPKNSIVSEMLGRFEQIKDRIISDYTIEDIVNICNTGDTDNDISTMNIHVGYL